MNSELSASSQRWRHFGINAGLLLLGSLLFALAFPSFLADWGWAPLAWICLVPIFILCRRVTWWAAPLWGFVYGYLTYSLFNFWLASFNPVSFILVPLIYGCYFFLIFFLLVLADRLFPRYGWVAQLLVWGGFEVLRTRGFLGYAYGTVGYSQYGWRSLIAIADIFGVMGVSLLVVFPSVLLAWWFMDHRTSHWRAAPWGRGRPFPQRQGRRNRKKVRWVIPVAVWGAAMLAANVYGIVSRVDYSEAPTWRTALVQHNVNAWLQGVEAYRKSLDSLMEVSREALDEDPDVLIWSETAFVPAIEWHDKYRREQDKAVLIRELKGFLRTLDIPVIMGNNDSEMDGGKKFDYNAVLLFDKDEIVNKYHKIHLVPFGEHFPYGETFPWLLDYIQSYDTPLYTAGSEYTVFDLSPWNGPRVGSLICFEDTFGYLSRNFIRAGAEVLVNVTNDAWSPEPACAIQHMTMAVFRSVENRRSLLRSTTSGITTVIDPNGKPIAKLDPFTREALIADVPVWTDRTTLYTRWGEWFDWTLVVLSVGVVVIMAVFGILKLIHRKTGGKRDEDE